MPKYEITPIPIRYGKIQTAAPQSTRGWLGLRCNAAEASISAYPISNATISVV